jgi:hypothetical protein
LLLLFFCGAQEKRAQKSFAHKPFGASAASDGFSVSDSFRFRQAEASMNLTALIIQLIAGALGGNAAGNLSKDINLGPVGNSIAGAIGGGVGSGSIVSAFVTVRGPTMPR